MEYDKYEIKIKKIEIDIKSLIIPSLSAWYKQNIKSLFSLLSSLLNGLESKKIYGIPCQLSLLK